ncbi:unnamed protein product [Prorocentrum cordatum]|uniref:Copia protein n=1 Tax=Prorocentrum cordatum TaxID=2364126 RepID=A0ABN9T2C5_9DINO|nr:unnamed protein product [Polarella glacialis]
MPIESHELRTSRRKLRLRLKHKDPALREGLCNELGARQRESLGLTLDVLPTATERREHLEALWEPYRRKVAGEAPKLVTDSSGQTRGVDPEPGRQRALCASKREWFDNSHSRALELLLLDGDELFEKAKPLLDRRQELQARQDAGEADDREQRELSRLLEELEVISCALAELEDSKGWREQRLQDTDGAPPGHSQRGAASSAAAPSRPSAGASSAAPLSLEEQAIVQVAGRGAMATVEDQMREQLRQQDQQIRELVATVQQLRAAPAPQPAQPAQPLVQLQPAVDTRLVGKPELFYGERAKWSDRAFICRAYLAAIDTKYPALLDEAEASEVVIRNVDLDQPWKASLSLQLYYLMVMLFRSAAQFSGDIPQSLDQFEHLIREYEQQSKKVFDEDLKFGLVVVNMQDTNVQQHLVKNASRLETWNAMKEELLDMARTTQYLNSQPKPMELANKEKECFYCHKKGHIAAECRKKARDNQARLAAAPEAAQQGGTGPPPTAQPVAGLMQIGQEEVQHGYLMPLCSPSDSGEMLAPMPQRVMVDTGAGRSVCPAGFDPRAEPDSSVKPTALTTATGEEVNFSDGKRSRFQAKDGSGVVLRYSDSDKAVVSASESTEQGNWLVCGPGVQRIIGPDHAEHLKEAVRQSSGLDMVKDRGVYWLEVRGATGQEEARPLCTAKAARKTFTPAEQQPAAPDAMQPAAQGEAPRPNVQQGGSSSSASGAMRPDPALPDQRPPALMPDSEDPRAPRAKAIPPTVSKAEWDAHQLTHLPFRSWCESCVAGKAAEDPHRQLQQAPDGATPKVCMDYLFLTQKAVEKEMYAVLNVLDAKSGAPFSGMVNQKGDDDYALAIAHEGVRFAGRTNLIACCDGESAINKLCDKFLETRPSGHTVTKVNAPKGSSQSAGLIERSNYEVEKEYRAVKHRLESVYKQAFPLSHKVQPWLVRHSSWLIVRFLVEADGKTPCERLRGKPYNGEIVEFGECVYHKSPLSEVGKAGDRWHLGVWLGKSMRSDEHLVGTAKGVLLCRSIWRRPEKDRWDAQLLDRFVGSPWAPVPPGVMEVKPREVYITLDRIIRLGKTPGCPGCRAPGEARRAAECRERFGKLVGAEKEDVAKRRQQRTLLKHTRLLLLHRQAVRAQASNSNNNSTSKLWKGQHQAAPPDVQMGEARVGQEDARDVEMEGEPQEDSQSKRSQLVAGLPILHEPAVVAAAFGTCVCFLAAAPDADSSVPQVCPAQMEWDKDFFSTKAGIKLDPQKVLEGKIREMTQIEAYKVKGDIPWSTARERKLKVVNSKWLLEPKPTAEDREAVRARLVATEVITYAREDVTQSTPPVKVFRIIVSLAASKQRADGSWSRLVAVYDVSVAFFHADSDGATAVIPPPDVRREGGDRKPPEEDDPLGHVRFSSSSKASHRDTPTVKFAASGIMEGMTAVLKTHQMSGEAEFYAIIKGAAQGVQTSQVIESFVGRECKLDVLSDSSAARGICNRQGSGKVRHLSAKDLWVQSFFRDSRGNLKKVDAEVNWADLGTKAHAQARLQQLVDMMPLRRNEPLRSERRKGLSSGRVASFLAMLNPCR